jgi:hypothetical protein
MQLIEVATAADSLMQTIKYTFYKLGTTKQ